jgi:L-alanine-DL-glutamate epimerase-like enolase superfamily enzyme
VKIVAVETLRTSLQPNVCILQLHTDEGISGLGETFYGSRAVESYIHESVAPLLLGRSDPAPESTAALLAPYVGYQGAGVEMRGNSAVDIALWDLLGKSTGRPVYELLGGPVRQAVPVYNTCAGSDYIKDQSRQSSENWGLDGPKATSAFEDLTAFLTRPGELARDLWDSGIRGMKIWPFDRAAEENGGTDITPGALAAGIEIVAAIREAVPADMRLLIECHGLWQLPAAPKILRALEPYDIFWVEDLVRPDNVSGMAELARSTTIPLAAGETVCGRRGFRPLLEAGAIDIAIVDVVWTGGLTEARKIASLADTYGVPVAPHDCTGPISLAAAVHLLMAVPNGLIQETCRAFYAGWYGELVATEPLISDGVIRPFAGPGLGIELATGFTKAEHVVRQTSSL